MRHPHPGREPAGPSAGRLVEQARRYLGSAERLAIATLEAAVRRKDAGAAEKAWSSVRQHLDLAEQCLREAGAMAAPDRAGAAAIAADVTAARAQCAQVHERGAALLAQARQRRAIEAAGRDRSAPRTTPTHPVRIATASAGSRTRKNQMIIEIRPEDSIAYSMPGIGFRVDTGTTGLTGRPFQDTGSYVRLNGPVGTPLTFWVVPSRERESDAAAVERAVSSELGSGRASYRMGEHGHVSIAGAARPAIAYATRSRIDGDGRCGVLVGTPAGSLLVGFGSQWTGEKLPGCADILELDGVRELVQSFTLLDAVASLEGDARPEPAGFDGAEKRDDVLGSIRRNRLGREELMALRPEDLVAAVFEVPQPAPGIGTCRLACAWQLEGHAVPREALATCARAWQAAREDLAPGPVPADALAALDSDLAHLTLGVPMLARWMVALRSRAATTAALDAVIYFLDDMRQVWWDLRGSLDRERWTRSGPR